MSDRKHRVINNKHHQGSKECCLFEELFLIPLRNGMNRPKSTRGSGIKMINMGELFANSRIRSIPMERVPVNEKELQINKLIPNDLLFARQSLVRSGAGKCSIFLGELEDVTYEGHIIRVRLDASITAPLFYYYYFNSIIGRSNIETIIEQVAAAGVRGSDLAKLVVPYPPLPTQKAIARAIFTSWFINFDPVRAKAEGRQPEGMDAATAALFPSEFETAEGQEIPKGWRISQLNDLIRVNEKTIGLDYCFSKINYIDISSVNVGKLENITEYCLKERPSRAQRIVNHGDTIWSCVRPNRRSYLYISNPHPNTIVSTGFAVLTPNKVPSSYVFFSTTTDFFIEYLTNNADGSAYPAVKADHFSKSEILLPSQEILISFHNIVNPLLEKISFNEKESNSLSSIRDTLLPKLLSGELPIDNPEKFIEATA